MRSYTESKEYSTIYTTRSNISFVVREDSVVEWPLLLQDHPKKKYGQYHAYDEHQILQEYFDDVQAFFVDRVEGLTHDVPLTSIEENKLRALFEEIVRVKHLIDSDPKIGKWG